MCHMKMDEASQLNDISLDAADCQDFEIWLNALGQFARHLLWRFSSGRSGSLFLLVDKAVGASEVLRLE